MWESPTAWWSGNSILVQWSHKCGGKIVTKVTSFLNYECVAQEICTSYFSFVPSSDIFFQRTDSVWEISHFVFSNSKNYCNLRCCLECGCTSVTGLDEVWNSTDDVHTLWRTTLAPCFDLLCQSVQRGLAGKVKLDSLKEKSSHPLSGFLTLFFLPHPPSIHVQRASSDEISKQSLKTQIRGEGR